MLIKKIKKGALSSYACGHGHCGLNIKVSVCTPHLYILKVIFSHLRIINLDCFNNVNFNRNNDAALSQRTNNLQTTFFITN